MGERLLVSGPQGLEARPALGGQGTIIEARAFLTACWSPDGKQVAFIVGDSLMVGGLNPEAAVIVATACSDAWSAAEAFAPGSGAVPPG